MKNTIKAYFQGSRGPCDYMGVDLRYLKVNEDYTEEGMNGKYFTPSFGWWAGEESFYDGDKCFMGKTKDDLPTNVEIFPSFEAAFLEFEEESL